MFCQLWCDKISIHAPTKGATYVYGSQVNSAVFQSTLPRRERPYFPMIFFDAPRISIHAPTKGATAALNASHQHDIRFQSTLPRRERRLSASDPSGRNPISIHAPTKGATIKAGALGGYIEFQSTLPRRERLRIRQQKRSKNEFQSTLPRRERH